MSPYEVLGVAKRAALPQIKTAYRKRARETHPDMGTDGAEFAKVAEAYAVLSDPEMRAHYDATGEINKQGVDAVANAMATILSSCFNSLLDDVTRKRIPVKSYDFIARMKEALGQSLGQAEQHAASVDEQIGHRTTMLKRIKRNDDEPNLFVEVLNVSLRDLTKLQKDLALNIAGLRRSIEELGHYKSEVELMQAVSIMQFGAGNFSSSNSTSGYINIWSGT